MAFRRIEGIPIGRFGRPQSRMVRVSRWAVARCEVLAESSGDKAMSDETSVNEAEEAWLGEGGAL